MKFAGGGVLLWGTGDGAYTPGLGVEPSAPPNVPAPSISLPAALVRLVVVGVVVVAADCCCYCMYIDRFPPCCCAQLW